MRAFSQATKPARSGSLTPNPEEPIMPSPKTDSSDLPPEREYERLNPGAGGSPSQQQERDKVNPATTRDDGGAGIPGSQNEDVKGHKPRGPRGAST
jgi:hypothetical protein